MVKSFLVSHLEYNNTYILLFTIISTILVCPFVIVEY